MSSTRKIFVFVVLPLLIIFLGVGGYYLLGQKETSSSQKQPVAQRDEQQISEKTVTWEWNGEKWVANSTAPSCPSPLLLDPPVDFQKVTAILYPGQVRGQYKAHGGFRFGTDNTVNVTAPLDATLIQGSRYIEGGEVQYLFEFVNNCGVAYRFDHLLTLTPTFQTIADGLPEAKPDDSRTTKIESVTVKKGDLIATEVGFKQTKNVSVDFGVYDYRTANTASKNKAYYDTHMREGSLIFHGVCWLDMFSAAEVTTLKALPGGDSVSGKQSDYCL